MLQMKDEKRLKKPDLYDRVELSSEGSEGFVSPGTLHNVLSMDADHVQTGLSPRKKRRDRDERHIMDLDVVGDDDDDDDRSHRDEAYDSEGKPRDYVDDRAGSSSLHDNRIRVNGIVVDQDIRGGPKPNWRQIYEIMFQSSTPNGQQMALALLIMVSLSVTCAVLDSVKSIREEYGDYLLVFELLFTIVFSIEYVLRVMCLRRPRKYIFSLIGIIDLCALVPTYLGLLVPDARPLLHLAVLRIFRVLRVFRVLRLARFVDAGAALSDNIEANKRRIAVFLVALFTLILVIGCAMYLIEGGRGFSNIPISLYWTVVTITTVGYGDIAPETLLGRMLATVVMFAGYGIIACPLVLNQTGGSHDVLTEVIDCPRCFRRFHQEDANFCRVCGTALRQPRVKTIRARRERMRGLHPLKAPTSVRIPTPNTAHMIEPSSTTSTAKSSAALLTDETMRLDADPQLRTA